MQPSEYRPGSSPRRSPAEEPGSGLLRPTEWDRLACSLRLSPREKQIVMALFDDEKDLAIGARLGLSHHTVHTYVRRLYRKLGVSSRSSALVRVFDEHLRLQRRTVRTRAPAPPPRLD